MNSFKAVWKQRQKSNNSLYCIYFNVLRFINNNNTKEKKITKRNACISTSIIPDRYIISVFFWHCYVGLFSFWAFQCPLDIFNLFLCFLWTKVWSLSSHLEFVRIVVCLLSFMISYQEPEKIYRRLLIQLIWKCHVIIFWSSF